METSAILAKMILYCPTECQCKSLLYLTHVDKTCVKFDLKYLEKVILFCYSCKI